jgi:hypothetical protein
MVTNPNTGLKELTYTVEQNGVQYYLLARNTVSTSLGAPTISTGNVPSGTLQIPATTPITQTYAPGSVDYWNKTLSGAQRIALGAQSAPNPTDFITQANTPGTQAYWDYMLSADQRAQLSSTIK